MKTETESPKDDLVQRIGELAKRSQELAREAERLYSTEVELILMAQSRDSSRIERCLDGMLGRRLHYYRGMGPGYAGRKSAVCQK